MGGISYHLRSLYNKIAASGHNITVLAGKCPQSWRELEEEIPEDIQVEPVQFGFREGYYILYPIALRKRLLSIDTDQFDIAVAHTPLPFEIPDVPLVTKYHDCIPKTRPYYRENLSKLKKRGDTLIHPIRKIINKRSFQKTDHAIFNSKINKDGWTSSYDVNLPYSVIYNGVDLDKFNPSRRRNENYVVFVGTTEQKGLTDVIEYADKNEYTVHIVGDIEVDHTNIVCHGRVSQKELQKIYSEATATVHPAKFESFGNSILESLACGTPVVTTSCCGASEILSKETGYTTRDISSGIEEVKKCSSDDCVQLAKKYSWCSVAEKTVSLLDDIRRKNND